MNNELGKIVGAGGILIEWFDLVGDSTDLRPIVEGIEQDRPQYSVRPGFVRKLLPYVLDVVTGDSYAGGSYLFDTEENAKRHLHWTKSEHRVDGMLFEELPFVRRFGGFVGSVVGAIDVDQQLENHASKRIIVWKAGEADAGTIAGKVWQQIERAAANGSLVSAWLGINKEDNTVGLVLVCKRWHDRGAHDYSSLELLRKLEIFDESTLQEQDVIVDRCMWVFTIWLPPMQEKVVQGVWPNSPPLPAPRNLMQISATRL